VLFISVISAQKKSPHCAVEYDGLNRFGYKWVLSSLRQSEKRVKLPLYWCWFTNHQVFQRAPQGYLKELSVFPKKV